MTAQSFVSWSIGTALAKQAQTVMDVILHIGAHRTATTTYQHYLRQNSKALAKQGVAVWTPRDTRNGLFHGILSNGLGAKASKRAKGRLALQLEGLHKRGMSKLIVSDENMLGTMRAAIKGRALYHDAGHRLAHFVQAFDGQVSRVVMSVRGQDKFWGSALGYVVARGRPVPCSDHLTAIAQAPRTWRDVVSDVACAADGAQTTVTSFDCLAGQPEAHYKAMTGFDGPRGFARKHLNATEHRPALRKTLLENGADPEVIPVGQGRWSPFTPHQTAALSEAWHDDHFWLRSGADGIATYIEDTSRTKAGLNLPSADLTRGHDTDDRQESRMAQTR